MLEVAQFLLLIIYASKIASIADLFAEFGNSLGCITVDSS